MILPPAQLTPSGRPVLQPGEVEISLLDKVDLEFQPVGGLAGQQAEAYHDGYLILTNRRMLWLDAGPRAAGPRAAALPLAAVVGSSKRVQYSLTGAKVRLVLEVRSDAQRQPVPVPLPHSRTDQLALRCRGPAPDAFKFQLDEQIRHAVFAAAATAAAAQSTTTAASSAGSPTSAAVGLQSSAGGRLADLHLSPLRAGLQTLKTSPSPTSLHAADGGVGGGASGGVSGARGRPSASPSVSPSPPPQRPGQPDPAMLQSMIEMGFPRNRCARSLVATGNAGVQEALDYLLAFGDQPGMDDPWDAQQPPRATSTTSPTALSSGGGWGSQPSPSFATNTNDAGSGNGFGAGAGGGRYPSIFPPTSGGASAAAGGMSPPPLLNESMRQLSLRPHPHTYGSAPELGSAVGGSGAASSSSSPSAAGAAIGVAGIVKREQHKTAESGRAVEQAFRDLSALMASAATMVALAEKFRGVAAAGAEGASAGGGEDPLLLDFETQQQLIALGISSPVTRETAGARYHVELSRQLADFLGAPLARCGGLLSLADVYCLFNRARGTELVSPDDLLQAAKLFVRAGVAGLRLRALSSGVLVVQGPQHSEEQVCAKIAQLTTPPAQQPHQPPSPRSLDKQQQPGLSLQPPLPGSSPPLGPGLTAGDVALAFGGIAVTIAAEHLLTAEARGVVCRDDGPEGLRFYRNFFLQDRLLDARGRVA